MFHSVCYLRDLRMELPVELLAIAQLQRPLNHDHVVLAWGNDWGLLCLLLLRAQLRDLDAH